MFLRVPPPVVKRSSPMQQIGIKRLKKVEDECGKEVNEILFHIHSSGAGHLDSLRELQVIVEAHGISRGDFATLVEAKKDAQKRVNTDEPVPPFEVMAQQLGMTVEQYFGWLDRQAKIFDNLRAVDEEDDFRQARQQSLFPAPWEDEDDLLQDMQEDGGQTGD